MRVVIIAMLLIAPVSAWAEDCSQLYDFSYGNSSKQNCRIANALEMIAEKMK